MHYTLPEPMFLQATHMTWIYFDREMHIAAYAFTRNELYCSFFDAFISSGRLAAAAAARDESCLSLFLLLSQSKHSLPLTAVATVKEVEKEMS